MIDATHAMEVADEESANLLYLEILRSKIENQMPIAVSRSSLWTGSGLPIPTGPSLGPLIARIGLVDDEPLVGGTSFYLGPWHVDKGSLVVFSWAAPVAACFYEVNSDHEFSARVAVRRTLSVDPIQLKVADFFDEWTSVDFESEGAVSPFAAKTRLTLPLPPEVDSSATPQRVQEHIPIVTPVTSAPVAPPLTPFIRSTVPVTGLRAEAAVRDSLAAPRKSGMHALLATLQPDQYELVASPSDIPLIVQGHPGTGKTVIAAHRAALLVNPERTRENSTPRVLLLGPNNSYASHVKSVLDSLVVSHRPEVMGMGAFLMGLRRLKIETKGPIDGEHSDVSIELGDFIEAAAHELRMTGALLRATGQQEATWMVYEALCNNSVDGIPLTDDSEWIRYLRRLPDFNTAVTSRVFLPLMAQCSLSAVPESRFMFDHIIVDEAQDVRPLEWRLLKSLNRGGMWTILGDMNQRRSDWSYHSWDHIARDIDLIDENEEASVKIFKRGYRSTGPIIEFANHLLPKDQRQVDSIQTEGPKPTVISCPPMKLSETVLATALELSEKYSLGKTAVIATDRRSILLKMQKDKWIRNSEDQRCFKKNGLEVLMLTPETARGLEFDAVVVVEPLDFPSNLGRQGPLYTSLTRANRELAVVHSKGLPDGLRTRR